MKNGPDIETDEDMADIRVRPVPEGIKRRLKSYAAAEGKTLNAVAVEAFEEYLVRRKK